MRKYILHIVLIIGCFQVLNTMAQDLYPAEKALMWTDRALFISGEQIHFAGSIHINQATDILSTVVYIELISPENQKIIQIKRPINKGSFDGEINIPEDILSGYYYLRAYTKWMRNGVPEDYEYLLIKIINPYQNEVLKVKDSLLLSHMIPQVKLNEEQVPTSHFSSNQTIDIDQIFTKHILIDQSLSLVPEGSQAYLLNNSHSLSSYDLMKFYPETRGLSISGKVFVADSMSPYHKINIHLLGEKDFMVVLCDSLGRFNVALPKAYQEQELFLIAASSKKGPVTIQIDQDFCHEKIELPCPKFSLEAAERDLLLRMAQNYQISHTFSEDEKHEILSKSHVPFYGSVFKTLELDFYVPLDSLEQYLTDIPSWVTVKRKKKKRYLQLVGDRIELTMYPSLLLVDWVPVDDADRVLAMNPKLVEKIEVLNQVYLHGEEIYGGIIHVQTYKGDFGNLKFPESGQYLNYQFYAPHSSNSATPYTFDNTQLWMPTVKSLEDLKIQTPPLPGSYLLMLQGINQQGKIERHIRRIQVK